MAGTPDPTSAYRAQQGLSGLGSVDPIVLDWTRRASAATGADAVALLATALQESGAQRGRVGDANTSYGPWQFHRGGALGSHNEAWANSYPAALNRAKEFARLKVHGGVGAAAVQRPASPGLYAQGVDSLLSRARELLGRSAPVPAAAAPARVKAAAAQPITDAPSAAGRMALLQGLLADAPANDLISLVQQAGGQGAPAPASPVVVSTPGPGAPKANPITGKPMALTPGGGWGGSKALATDFARLGESLGLSIASEKRDRKNTASGGISDHWVGSKNAYAYDMSNGSRPTPQMDAFAAQAAAQLGVKGWKGGVLNVTRGGYRYQLLYRTNVGGNHFNHVHVGVRKV